MFLIKLIILVFLNVTVNCDSFYIYHTFSSHCVIDNRSTDINVEQKLQKDLMKDYSSRTPPCANTTEIGIRFLLKHMSFDEREEHLYIFVLIYLDWKDHRLVWKPEDYDNIYMTQLKSFPLWKPKVPFAIHDLIDMNSFEPSTLVEVTKDGKVLSKRDFFFKTRCDTDLRDWPYDIQHCSYKLTDKSSAYYFQNKPFGYRNQGDNFIFPYHIGTSGIITSDIAGWDILNFGNIVTGGNETTFELNFVVKRRALVYAEIIIVPSIVLAIFTWYSIFLDVTCNIRICIVSVSLLCYFTLLEVISVFLPRQDSKSPLILQFISASIFITTFMIFLTITLNLLLKKRISSVNRVRSLNEQILGTRLKYFIIQTCKASKEYEESSGTSDIEEIWTNFVNIVNTLVLYAYLIIYLILYFMLIPSSGK